VGSIAQTQARVRELQRAAEVALAHGKAEDAIADYQQALSLSPRSIALNLRVADLYFRMGQFPAAIESYNRVLQVSPQHQDAALGLGRSYCGIYNYDECRRLLRDWSKKHLNKGAALLELGKLEIRQQHYDDAIAELKQAIQREPGLVEARVRLGAAYQAKGDEEKALRQLNEAVRLDPRSASAHYFRGLLYSERDDNERAYQDAKEAYRLDPAIVESRVLLGKVATRVQKCGEAVDLLKPLTDSPTSEAQNLYLLARAYQCANKPELASQAQAEFDRRSKQEQEARTQKMDADHLAEQAGEYARKNQLAPALELLTQALAKDAENGPSLALMAKIDFSRGDVPKAREEIEAALRTSAYNPDYLYVLGKVLEAQQEWQRALEAFQKTVLVNPRESDAYYEMGQVYARLGDRARAVRAAEKAVELSPEDADYKRALQVLAGTKP